MRINDTAIKTVSTNDVVNGILGCICPSLFITTVPEHHRIRSRHEYRYSFF